MVKCMLCRSSQDDELWLGRFYIRRQGYGVHENCLYLSSNLVQRGTETNGICCFTPADINAEANRTSRLKCFYCHQRGANIGCCGPRCKRSFHTLCGLKNGAVNQYCLTFKSFCHSHIEKHKNRPSSDEKCVICMDTLKKGKKSFDFTKYIFGECCKQGWYHKSCLQKYANSAGYFFKCPLCNDVEKFKRICFWGITIPNRDASWEDTDAYVGELLFISTCTAEICHFGDVRESSVFDFLYCELCGGNPMHFQCTSLPHDNYRCNDCIVVEVESLAQLDDTLESVKDEDCIKVEKENAAQQDDAMDSVKNDEDQIVKVEDTDSDSAVDDGEIFAIIAKINEDKNRIQAAIRAETARINGIAPLRERNRIVLSPRTPERKETRVLAPNNHATTDKNGNENKENIVVKPPSSPSRYGYDSDGEYDYKLCIRQVIQDARAADIEVKDRQFILGILNEDVDDDLQIAIAVCRMKSAIYEKSQKDAMRAKQTATITSSESKAQMPIKEEPIELLSLRDLKIEKQEENNGDIGLPAQLTATQTHLAPAVDSPKKTKTPQSLKRPDDQQVAPESEIASKRQSRLRNRPQTIAVDEQEIEDEIRPKRSRDRPSRLRHRRVTVTVDRLEKEKDQKQQRSRSPLKGHNDANNVAQLTATEDRAARLRCRRRRSTLNRRSSQVDLI
ncbi:hypothetical protein KR044_008835 [Drosophila immigrans]|nr:hypothetical protein KR044_008835 [Drosophila immigrans]